MCAMFLFISSFSRKSIVRAHDVKILRSEKPKYGKTRSHDDQDYSSSSDMGKKPRFRNAKSTFAVLPNLLFFARRGFPPRPSILQCGKSGLISQG